ncbi:von Willebrand factor type A domain-containing protein [Verrucomicrobiaceae bacterium R5-34]|nr:von Willebrand factor type A domain-containing protein [Verrucomicrobiaceae bacterium R5-34]
MKIDVNDPRITAFALGELTGSEAVEIARAMHSDPRIRRAVDEVRETASLLHGTLGDGASEFLTPEQRETVRSAGGGPVIEDIASGQVPFWKRPAVVGIGAAAAVAIGLFLSQRSGHQSQPRDLADGGNGMDWSQVDMENLSSPAVVDGSGGDVAPAPNSDLGTPARSVASAISEDTDRYRRELTRRINQQDLQSPLPMPELEEADWKTIGSGSSSFEVPVASGASSWPLLRRYVTEQKTLPPARAIRIEELVNHFGYRPPGMLKGNGLVADFELCQTPWNPATILLAVHLGAASAQPPTAAAVVDFNPDNVKRARLLGYAGVKPGMAAAPAGPGKLSRSHGNYVIYELQPNEAATGAISEAATLVTLRLGTQPEDSLNMTGGQVQAWTAASADLRFASTVTATGMLLSETSARGKLDAGELLSMVDVIEQNDLGPFPDARGEALELLKAIAALMAQGE